jgi:hypothetical protein
MIVFGKPAFPLLVAIAALAVNGFVSTLQKFCGFLICNGIPAFRLPVVALTDTMRGMYGFELP